MLWGEKHVDDARHWRRIGRLLQAYRKLKVMQITTHRRASLTAQREDHRETMERSLLITGQVDCGVMDTQQTKPQCHNIQIISDCVFLI